MLFLSEFSPFIEREDGSEEFLFKGMSMSVNLGQCFGIVGPNGSGKSTLFRAIVGLHEQYKGVIKSKALDESMVLMNQNYRQSILPWLNVSQHLSRSLTEQQFEFANIFLNRLEFSPKGSQTLRDLSGGELQILLLSTLLAKQPDLILLDEPLSAIDFRRRKLATDVLSEYREQNKTAILVISHSLSDLVPLCTEAFVISGQRGDITKKITLNSNLKEHDMFKV